MVYEMQHPDHVCLLQRSLYGLKQARFRDLRLMLLGLGFIIVAQIHHFSSLTRVLHDLILTQLTLFLDLAVAGVANAVAETCWLRNLLRELHTPLATATLVYCDNVSAVYLSSNPVQHQRTKHIEIDIHFVRDLVLPGAIRVLHVPSRYQYADIFTKGLPTSLFDEFRTSLSVRSPPAPTVGEYAFDSRLSPTTNLRLLLNLMDYVTGFKYGFVLPWWNVVEDDKALYLLRGMPAMHKEFMDELSKTRTKEYVPRYEFMFAIHPDDVKDSVRDMNLSFHLHVMRGVDSEPSGYYYHVLQIKRNTRDLLNGPVVSHFSLSSWVTKMKMIV
ncbi:ribonuclease H-like domain-containing protein [Tanacetum coccineum]